MLAYAEKCSHILVLDCTARDGANLSKNQSEEILIEYVAEWNGSAGLCRCHHTSRALISTAGMTVEALGMWRS